MHPADVQDRDGGVLVLVTLFGLQPCLKKLFADGGDQGTKFADRVADVLPQLAIEIVKRSDTADGFKVLPPSCKGFREIHRQRQTPLATFRTEAEQHRRF
ncbi:hypothetical protein [Defluviicoccus vanus]|uniref:hypothetical protein n=1 Tax=Defluviicoccus vanus TaxID=111831 RepID=UPI001CBA6862|nr:hypothetical protein [Defluviicoccus vanus]